MEDEREIEKVLVYQDRLLSSIEVPDKEKIEERISVSENLLAELGYSLPDRSANAPAHALDSKKLGLPSWDDLSREAEDSVGEDANLEQLFSEEELRENALVVRRLNNEFDQIHRLDKCEVAIAAAAGILAGIVDVLLVGIPDKTPDGLKAGPLSDLIRDAYDKKYPQELMQELANKKISKVPYDAQDNRNTTVLVEGLSSYYHRLVSLGHDPWLGFIFGVADILSGTMTTIDKNGHVVIQVIEKYADRTEADVFKAIAKQALHLKTDITTSMGLPVPFMALFNLMQFGHIGEYDQTIAEIVQGMYHEGYDFIHFRSMMISTMTVEAFVRIAYALKRIGEGVPVGDAIPLTTNREKMPKLGTMLFIAHSIAAAINAGKMLFSKDPTMAIPVPGTNIVIDPMAVNYPQWIAFAKYSYQQLKWSLVTKPAMRDRYVLNSIDDELYGVYEEIDTLFDEIAIVNVPPLPAST